MNEINKNFTRQVINHYGTYLIFQFPVYGLEWYQTAKNLGIVNSSFTIGWYSKIRIVEYLSNSIYVIIRVVEPYIFYSLVPSACLPKRIRKKRDEMPDAYQTFLNSNMNT